MTSARDILLVGGYGVVGRRIAARLAPLFPGQVVIAGRDQQRAGDLCRELGHGSRPRRIDIGDVAAISSALDGVHTVMTCVAQPEMHLLRTCITRGVAYTDIAPRLAFWQGAEEMAAEARQTGARIVLGAGLSPGISNMMAARMAKEIGRADSIETAILLSVGDEYGPDSLHHVLEAVTQPFTVLRAGHRQPAVPFSEGARVVFPTPLGARTAYLFPWSDVVYYPKTLGAQTSVGRFALEPAWAGRLASVLVHVGARRWLKRPGFSRGNRRAIDRLKRIYAGHDHFALVVTVEGGGRVMTMSLAGRHQADATAAGAAELARALAADEVERAGVWPPEEVISADRFFDALTALGWRPTMAESSSAAAGQARQRRGRLGKAHP